MKNKILVTYLSSCYTESKNFNNFLRYYEKYKAGIKHDLIVCFKNLTTIQLKKRIILLKKKYKYFVDPETKNDYEWGSLKRICEKYKNKYIFFLNDHSYPVCKNWLKIISNKIKTNRIIACSASNSSHFNNAFYRHKNDSYLSAFIKILKYLIFVPQFPNPHIRTTGFLIHAKNYLEFIQNKKFHNKFESLLIESGKNSFTNYFIKKGFEIVVVNNKNKIFYKDEWKSSETFSFRNQSGFIISDNQIRKYSKLDKKNRQKNSYKCWGGS